MGDFSLPIPHLAASFLMSEQRALIRHWDSTLVQTLPIACPTCLPEPGRAPPSPKTAAQCCIPLFMLFSQVTRAQDAVSPKHSNGSLHEHNAESYEGLGEISGILVSQGIEDLRVR